MAKKAYSFNKAKLQEAIRKVEKEQKPSSHSELWQLVAAEYNVANNPAKSLQAGTAKTRAEEWGLKVTTPKGERGKGRPSTTKPPVAPKPIKVFDEGGPGRKPCHKCGKFYGVRVGACPACGATYVKQPKAPKPKVERKRKAIKDYPVHDEGGKGRKECPGCHKFYFARLPKCPACDTEYVKPEPEIKTYDGPGRLRKQCPECHKYLGYKAPECVCGHDFSADDPQDVPSPSDKPNITTYDEDGPRRKQCPECEFFVGYSVETCVCGHEFPKQEVGVAKADCWSTPTNTDIEASHSLHRCGCDNMLIYTPQGSSPAKLDAADEESVAAWHDKVMEAGHAKGRHYSPAALRYFLARYHFDFDRNSDEDEYAEACEVLRSIYSQQAKSKSDYEEEELAEV